MSGHSKWHKIKGQKGATDAKRSAAFTQLARAITITARDGGGDPSMNHQLKTAIEKAKAGNVPKDNIERAIKKGTGELASEAIEEIVYEGYGPGGSAVLVESVTDNRNRTAADIKHIFSRHAGNLGGAGSVGWMFERKGILRIERSALSGKNIDDVELEMIDAGAEDVRREEDGLLVFTSMESLSETKEKVEAAGYEIVSGDLEYLAKDAVPYNETLHKDLDALLEALEDNEDVQATYTNVDI